MKEIPKEIIDKAIEYGNNIGGEVSELMQNDQKIDPYAITKNAVLYGYQLATDGRDGRCKNCDRKIENKNYESFCSSECRSEFRAWKSTDGRESFWTEEMILRFAELYRWSSARITMKGFKQSKDWQTASIHAAKEIAKQIDDGREELEKENEALKNRIDEIEKGDDYDMLEKQQQKITALQSSLKEKEKQCEVWKKIASEFELQMESLLIEKDMKIEELKAENERLKIEKGRLKQEANKWFEKCEELKEWKKQAIAVTPPMQEIAKAINLRLGEHTNDKILPYIEKLKAENERLKVLIEGYIKGQWLWFSEEHQNNKWQQFKTKNNL